MLSREQIAVFALAVVLIAVPLALGTYVLIGHQMPLAFLAITGGDAQYSTGHLSVGKITSSSCQVTFDSAFGSKTITAPADCAFDFNPPYTGVADYSGPEAPGAKEMGYTSVDIQSVSRGMLSARVGAQSMVGITSNANNRPNYQNYGLGYQVFDYLLDDLDWGLVYYENGVRKTSELGSGWQCSGGKINTGGLYPRACSSSYSLSLIPGARDEMYISSNPGANNQVMVDSSNTFQLTYDGTWHFKIINPEFITQEVAAQNNIPSYLHYRALDCPIKDGWMLASQDFAAGSTVTAASFRYPVNYFCKSVPVINVSSSQVVTSSDPYQTIVANGAVHVPSNQVWEFFYVIRLTNDIPLICSPDVLENNLDGSCPVGTTVSADGLCYAERVFNTNNNQCEVKPGIVHFCSEGIWDQVSMACVVQPDAHIVCPQGSAYDMQLQACTYKPPKQAVCDDPRSIYDADLDKCVYNPERQPVCPSDSSYVACPGGISGGQGTNCDYCAYTPNYKVSCDTRTDQFGDDYTPTPAQVGGEWMCAYKCDQRNSTGGLLFFLGGYLSFLSTSCTGDTCDCVANGGTLANNTVTGEPYCIVGSGNQNPAPPADDCSRPANKVYDPCTSGYVATVPGTCTKTPLYVNNTSCPSGYTYTGGVCLSGNVRHVDCQTGFYYDLVTQECSKVMAGSYYCEQASGTWNAATSTCYTPPKTESSSCPENFNWNNLTQTCYKKMALETVYICIKGTYDSSTQKCMVPGTAQIYDPTPGVCNSGTYNPTSHQCESTQTMSMLSDSDITSAINLQNALYLAIGVFILACAFLGVIVAKKVKV
jgi:hypothetical protein